MRRILASGALVLLNMICGNVFGQSSATASASFANVGAVPPSNSASLPNAPDADRLEINPEPLQTKRILGVIPNFRAVSTTRQLPPQSVKEKFLTGTEDSFDYSSVAIPAALAGFGLARNATPEFGTGSVGYGRYLWHSAIDQTSENYMVEFVVPVLTHEDTRFYTLESGSFLKRTEYAVSRALITRSDTGSKVINLSEIVGSGAAAGLSNAYYPAQERSFANTSTQWGLDIGIDAAAFVAKEFWPDINRHLFHGN
jgi:hypothetical protein